MAWAVVVLVRLQFLVEVVGREGRESTVDVSPGTGRTTIDMR
jgi:hypothetical protein